MGQVPTSLQAKRRGSRISNIKERVEAGEDMSDKRALVRIGKMNTKILTGQEDLSVWSDEELRRGQRKDKNGRWQGRAPLVIPKAIHDELVRRTLDKANELLRDNLVLGVEALVDIIRGQDTEDKDRLKAIDMLMVRVMGTAPVRLDADIRVSAFEEVVQQVTIKREGFGQLIDTTATEDE